VLRWPVSVAGWLESAREALEEETRRWAFLCPVEPVAAPVAAPAALGEDGDADPLRLPHHLPHYLDDELRALVAMREGWDELVGHLGLLVSMLVRAPAVEEPREMVLTGPRAAAERPAHPQGEPARSRARSLEEADAGVARRARGERE
jgi:hypothetical protein